MATNDREHGRIAADAAAREAWREAEAQALLADLDSPQRPQKRLFLSQSPFRRYAVSLALVGGILLGWLVIGWGLWPVGWVECSPWDMQEAYQKRYVALVAAEYARTGDAAQAQSDLAGWDPQSLSHLLAVMESEAPNPDANATLAALQQTLSIEDATPSLWDSILRQKPILASAALAALLLAAALIVPAIPHLGHIGKGKEEQQQHTGHALPAGEGKLVAPWLEAVQEIEQETAVPSAAPGPDKGQLVAQAGQDQQGKEDEPGKPTEGPKAGAPTGERKVERVPADGKKAEESSADPKVKKASEGARKKDTPQGDKAEKASSEGEPSKPEAASSIAEEDEDAEEEEHLEGQDLLADLLEGALVSDPHRDALAGYAQTVDIVDLVQKSKSVLNRLKYSHRREAAEP